MKSLRAHVGVLLFDLPRYLAALATRRGWLGLCNRGESLEWAPDRSGVRCLWQWTSDLRAPKVWPWLGRRLMARALASHPLRFADEVATDAPALSFIIGHRGRERLPLLLATLRSIAGQRGVGIECIVVEQDAQPMLRDALPDWVRHVPAPPPSADMPYCRSWAFNIGVRHAKGRVLVLHDNDFLVPADYAATIVALVDRGFDVVNPKRLMFYLDRASTDRFTAKAGELGSAGLDAIVQNLEGGGSIAIAREAYAAIGGMDEGFVGWGGEDNEFWERAATLKLWPYGGLPLVHLWHAAQAGKHQAATDTAARYRELQAVPVDERIRRLVAAGQGELSGPKGWPRPSGT